MISKKAKQKLLAEIAKADLTVYVLFGRHGDGHIEGVTLSESAAQAWKFAENGKDQDYRHVVPMVLTTD